MEVVVAIVVTYVALWLILPSSPDNDALRRCAQELKWIREELQKRNGTLPKDW